MNASVHNKIGTQVLLSRSKETNLGRGSNAQSNGSSSVFTVFYYWPRQHKYQVELYNEEMKDEILVTRRATYKAEEAVSNLEKDKGRQDLLIDGLMDQVRTRMLYSLRFPGEHREPATRAPPTMFAISRAVHKYPAGLWPIASCHNCGT